MENIDFTGLKDSLLIEVLKNRGYIILKQKNHDKKQTVTGKLQKSTQGNFKQQK